MDLGIVGYNSYLAPKSDYYFLVFQNEDDWPSKPDVLQQKRITDPADNGIAEGGGNQNMPLSKSLVVGMNQAKGGQSDGKFNKSEDDGPCTEGGFIALDNQGNVNK